MIELLQREKKEAHRFPGLMERLPKIPEASPIQKTESESPAKPEQESVPKKRGRPKKDSATTSETPKRKGPDPKNAKVL